MAEPEDNEISQANIYSQSLTKYTTLSRLEDNTKYIFFLIGRKCGSQRQKNCAQMSKYSLVLLD